MNSGKDVMQADYSEDELYSRLRRLVVADPKGARALISRLVREDARTLQGILERASRPGEGRVRQMLAVAVRLKDEANIIESHLRAWAAIEPDEFTKAAITAALHSIPRTPTPAIRSFEMPSHFVEAYRYASERLCHRVRNPLTRSAALLVQLKNAACTCSDPVLRDELTKMHVDLQTLVERVGHVVEFDPNGAYLTWRSIALGEWLESSAPRFAARYGPAQFALRAATDSRSNCIRGTDFLLETIFGNAWANAIQAVAETDAAACCIVADLTVADGWMTVVMQDSGPGFSEEQFENAFRVPFSTKAATRGRGLLEIAEAVGRMQGSVSLEAERPGVYRMQVRLPLDPR